MVMPQRADWRCPGALHGLQARDGTLVRIRIPGGLLTPAQLGAIARAARRYGDSNIDITSRANVQLRGIHESALADLGAELERASLLPSAAHDRVRNIGISPFAGVDAGEVVDVRPLARDLDAWIIAEPALAALPAKFSFALDGGARTFDASGADLAARAVATQQGTRFHIFCAGEASGFGAPADRVVHALVEAARLALKVAQRHVGEHETWRLSALRPAHPAIRERLAQGFDPCPQPPTTRSTAIPLGVEPAHEAHLINLVPSVALGRLSCTQADAIAALAQRFDAQLRLGWWRGFVIAAAPRPALQEIAEELARLGLPLDRSDGFAGIAACSGTQGCTRAHADVRAHAAELARRLAGRAVPAGWSVNVAGCEKRCAMRHRLGVELVARAGGYDVAVDGTRVSSSASPESALEAAMDAHACAMRVHHDV